jgi:hypothetical protein
MVQAGGGVVLTWDVINGREVFFEDEPVAFKGARRVKVEAAKTFKLRVVYGAANAAKEEVREVAIQLLEADCSAAPTPPPASPPPVPVVVTEEPLEDVPPKTWKHAFQLVPGTSTFHLRPASPGKFSVKANWTGSQRLLKLTFHDVLDNPFFTNAHTYPGEGKVEKEFELKREEYSPSNSYRVSISAPGHGEADGSLSLAFPARVTTDPLNASFIVHRDTATVSSVLPLEAAGEIKALATWSGKPATMTLLVFGPGQATEYARKEGPSPLELTFSVTKAQLASGRMWHVQLRYDVAHGTIISDLLGRDVLEPTGEMTLQYP